MRVKPELEWEKVAAKVRKTTPEAFDQTGRVLNLVGGEWKEPGKQKPFRSAVDGTELGSYPIITLDAAREAVEFAAGEASDWTKVELDERRSRVAKAVAALREHSELIVHLLMWEIGKPHALAKADIDRCLEGVEWYLEEIESMLGSRSPVGLVSNIASWNYPMSVLMHGVLVQLLCGNAVIAKTPSDGGLFALTVAFALTRREGLPVSLVSGPGAELADALVTNNRIGALAFVGGKSNGRDVAAQLYDKHKRHMLEMEGVNGYGVWEFSDWPGLQKQLVKGFEYGKQRCTAYPRFIVQRRLFPKFLETYVAATRDVRFGHPLAVERDEDPLPELSFGPMITSSKARDLREKVDSTIDSGAFALMERELDDGKFLPGQDISAYFAPIALTNVPRSSPLYFNEPFGPVDSFVIVDSLEELIGEMNISNGALVASIACDDLKCAERVISELRAFKTGINTMRSRGDREELFGGIGQSWRGCFVGGKCLVEAVSNGDSDDQLAGNFPDHTILPESR